MAVSDRDGEPTELSSLISSRTPSPDLERQDRIEVGEYRPHSRIIYNTTIALGIGNIIGAVPHAYTAGTYAAKGTTHVLRLFRDDIPELPAEYANLTSEENLKKLAHPFAEFNRGGSFVTELVANVAQFDIRHKARETDQWVHATFYPLEGRVSACKGWFVNSFSSCSKVSKSLFRASSYFFVGVAFAAGTYPTVQQAAGPLVNLLGKPLGYATVTYLFSSGFSGYVFGYAKGCKQGIQYWINWINKPNILERYEKHECMAIEVQSTTEGGVIITTRIFFSSFSLGELAQQLGLDPATVVFFYIAGGISGLYFGAMNFVPSTSQNYLKYFDPYEEKGIAYDAITVEERNRVYEDAYGDDCSCCLSCRAYVEITRGFPIGYIQAYGSYCLAAPFGGPIVGYLAATAGYALFCRADLQKELNVKAHQHREVNGTGRSAVQPKQPNYGSTVGHKAAAQEEEYEPSRCAIISGTMVSVTQNFFRIFQNVYSVTKNSVIGHFWSRPTEVKAGLITGAIQGKNRDERFRLQMIDTFAKWGCRKPKVSKQGMFASSSEQQSPVPLAAQDQPPSRRQTN